MEDGSWKIYTRNRDLRGCPKQAFDYNFQDALLNVRHGKLCKRFGKPTDFVDPEWLTDLRHEDRRQIADGNRCLLCNSVVFHHESARKWVDHEYLACQGWYGCDISSMTVPIPEMDAFKPLSPYAKKKAAAQPAAPVTPAAAAPPSKRKRLSQRGSKLSDQLPTSAFSLANGRAAMKLMGNAMCAPELCGLQEIANLVTQSDLWERPLDETLLLPDIACQRVVSIPLSADFAAVYNSQVKDDGGSDGADEDEDDDDDGDLLDD